MSYSKDIPTTNVVLVSCAGAILGATMRIGTIVAMAGAVITVLAAVFNAATTVGIGIDTLKAGLGVLAIGLAGFVLVAILGFIAYARSN